MIPTISELGGKTQDFMRWPDPDEPGWSAFNPSIAVSPVHGLGMLIRSSNYVINDRTGVIQLLFGQYIMTRIWYAELNDDLSISFLHEIAFDHGDLPIRRGVEDPRLFWRDDGWHFTAVMLEKHTPHSRLCEYRLDTETLTATFLGKLETETPKNPEKNWGPPDVATKEFDYIYSTTHTYRDGKIQPIAGATKIDAIRGGSQLLRQKDGTYLAIVHTVKVASYSAMNTRTFASEVRWIRDYAHVFVRYSPQGKIIEISDEFSFESGGVGIEYAAGMVELGSDLVISYGEVDVASRLCIIPKDQVEKLLQCTP